jgi:hypothetical protein
MQETPLRTIAVLCAARKTAYRDIPGVEVYDEVRDARNFPGGMPVIAHPPCRRWTRFGKAMLAGTKTRCPGWTPPSKEEIADEKNLGLFCARMVQECGGILEQPANSELFAAAGLPLPGSPQGPESFSLHVWQRWWGFPNKKGTWLYFCGISQFSIEIPFSLHNRGGDRQRFENMPGGNHAWYRSHTVPALARWLVDLARTATVGNSIDSPCFPKSRRA